MDAQEALSSEAEKSISPFFGRNLRAEPDVSAASLPLFGSAANARPMQFATIGHP
jgi:hypothetical protein